MNTINNRFIITGGPGSGKSTLLSQLSDHGYCCFEEISRIVIQEQHQIGGDKVPWRNLPDFAEICFQRMSAQLLECTADKNCFFDRGLPDIIAYLRRRGCDVPKRYFKHSKQYNKTVFLAPPWKEIFINDAERPESFEDSMEISLFLKNTYEELGFRVIELPKSSIKHRVKFINNYLSGANDL
ncbi:AAA family ATPase [Labilibaculum sp.]|uniref:AAA family ATPase n=1 Tax=Labilibaculum sp. TaxID=2060723 RepID=UPI003566E387